jgi:Asp/Glu/hydantoin racemase
LEAEVTALLIINPNTSESVTALLQQHGQRIAGPDVRVSSVTARFGAPYIACEASFAVAGHAVLDAWARALAQNAAGFDSVLIGCFGDPGLMALLHSSEAPVTGLAQAAFAQAASAGRFAVVTGGAGWKPMLERLAQQLGYSSQLAGIHTLEQSGAELARNPAAAKMLLRQACNHAAREFAAATVIVGGAGLAGMARSIAAEVEVPLIDSVEAGVVQALRLHRPALAVPRGSRLFDFAWTNVSDELAALGRPGTLQD